MTSWKLIVIKVGKSSIRCKSFATPAFIENFVCTVKAEIPLASKLDLSLKNIEEFVPDDHLDKSFLDDSSHQVTVHKPSPGNDSDRLVVEKFGK